MKTIYLSFMLLFIAYSTQAQGISFEHGTFDEALQKANAENKILFMDCYTTWCGPCKMLQNNTFPNPEVGSFFNDNFISIKIDCEKGEGPSICGRFGVSAYPTLLFIDGSGKVVQKTMGYRPPESLISEGRRAMGGSTSVLNEYKNKYTAGDRSEDVLKGLVINLSKNGESFDSYWSEYLATQKSENLLNDVNAKLIFELTQHVNSPSLKYFTEFKSYFIEKYGAESYEKRQESIVGRSVREAIQKNDIALFNKAIGVIKANKMSHGDMFITKMSLLFYGQTKDMVNYDKVAMVYLKKNKKIAPNEFSDIMNNYIQYIDNPKLVTKAIAICKKSVAKENKFYNNYALAALLFKTGNKSDAYAIAQYAVELGKKEGINYWAAQELVNKIQIERGAKQ